MMMLKRVTSSAMGVYDVMIKGKTSALPFGAPFPQVVRSSDMEKTELKGEAVVVLMAHTPDVDCYGNLSAQINSLYCERHGYRLKVVVGDPLDRAHWVTWDKVKHIRNTLEDPSVECVFWIDSDAIFNVQRMELGEFAIKGADICICADVPWRLGVNTGTMLVRNTQWSRDFLDSWWSRANSSAFANVKAHEQSEFGRMLSEDISSCRTGGKVALFPSTAFNGAHWLPNPHERFVLHYMNTDKDFRIRVLTSRLCSLRMLDDIIKKRKN
jgi:hypothetical protein